MTYCPENLERIKLIFRIFLLCLIWKQHVEQVYLWPWLHKWGISFGKTAACLSSVPKSKFACTNLELSVLQLDGSVIGYFPKLEL